MNSVKKQIVFIGAGHAHLFSFVRIKSFVRKGCEVRIVSPDPYAYYSGMGPGLLSGMYRPCDVRFHIKKLVESSGGIFIPAKVEKIIPKDNILLLSNGNSTHYDILSCNIGSELHKLPGDDADVYNVKPITELMRLREALIKDVRPDEKNILVAGGGPAGVEIAANLFRLIDENRLRARITLVSGMKLLAQFAPMAGEYAVHSLLNRGIRMLERVSIVRVADHRAFLDNGDALPFDMLIWAAGIHPPRLFHDSGITTGDDGGMLVDAHLRSIDCTDIFGAGDCVSFAPRSLSRVGVYAVRQGVTLFHNLHAMIDGRAFKEFIPQKSHLLILNMGNGRGLSIKGKKVRESVSAMRLKNYIDNRFMKKFQRAGERSDT